MNKNLGVIIESPKPQDWMAGGITGIVDDYEVEDWTDYLPTNENQYDAEDRYDTMACVPYSACNGIEAQFNYWIATKKLSESRTNWLKVNGYLDGYGKVNFSDRDLAKLSGTTKKGNTFTKVGDAAHHSGLVPEADYPFEATSWDDYYKEIPQHLIDKGKEFLKLFNINYQWVDLSGNIAYHLKTAPIQICLPTKWKQVDGVYYTDSTTITHAVTLYKMDDYKNILDHYLPYLKKLNPDYMIHPWGLQYKITENKSPMMFKKEKDSDDIYMIVGSKKTMIIDIPTLEVFGEEFDEVESLDQYEDHGTLNWTERIIQ